MNLKTFWSLIEKTETCWFWKGYIDYRGYGLCDIGPKKRKSVHVVYEQLIGPIPYGHLLHHVCKNKACVNVLSKDHVVLRTPKTHEDDGGGVNRAKTHCKYGHEFTKENTQLNIDYRGQKHRQCVICSREATIKYRQTHGK